MTFTRLFALALASLVVEQFVLVKYLGLAPVLEGPGKTRTILGLGLAAALVMGLAAPLTALIDALLLAPLNLGYLRAMVVILTVAAPVKLAELALRRGRPALHTALHLYFPLITIHCTVLGIAGFRTPTQNIFLWAAADGVLGGLVFTLAMLLFSTVWERLSLSKCPKCFEGFPIALITAGLLAMAFMGFSGP